MSHNAMDRRAAVSRTSCASSCDADARVIRAWSGIRAIVHRPPLAEGRPAKNVGELLRIELRFERVRDPRHGILVALPRAGQTRPVTLAIVIPTVDNPQSIVNDSINKSSIPKPPPSRSLASPAHFRLACLGLPCVGLFTERCVCYSQSPRAFSPPWPSC